MSSLLSSVRGSLIFTLITQFHKEVMVKVTKCVTSRPRVVFIVTGMMVILVACISITNWQATTEKISDEIAYFTDDFHSSVVSEIGNMEKFIYPKTNSSTSGLARAIDSLLTNNNTLFTQIQTQIAPILFQAYSMIPQVSQVSYISRDGLLFSYVTELNKSVAVFANSSSDGYAWYTQTVDQLTGLLNGNATKSQPEDVTHTEWFQAAQRNGITTFVGTGLRRQDKETMFLNVVNLYSKKGVVSLGFPVKSFTSVLDSLKLHGGEIYLWTKDGTVLAREGSLTNASGVISNGSICFGSRSRCIPENCTLTSAYEVEIGKGSKFQAFCSIIEVSGVPLKYTLLLPNNRGATIIKQAANWGMFLIICLTMYALLWPIGFLWFMSRAARVERHMRATLTDQMEATQQAERKSMNKSQAFAQASHDIRGGLRGIYDLIDTCLKEEKFDPDSELKTSLKQVNVCTQDLLGLLNSVLDMSKIESGKMQLDEEEFNLAQLLEDVADFHHPSGMKKGVDVVLDFYDGSVLKNSNVQGDSGKLKQILNNLLTNAIKFTDNGHITIRAWAQRPASMTSIALASNPKESITKLLKSAFHRNESEETEILNSVKTTNANKMEFVFEVDDTGSGIPMEMRKSVFENYVQVKETARGTQGTGLGLGIVQSLVRLMGGEIRITEKAMGERGTCFRFNVLLTTLDSCSGSEMKVRQDIEDYVSTPNLGLTIKTSVGGNMNIRNRSPKFNKGLSSSPKQEPSKVVLLMKSEERRRVTEKYIKSLGIKVTMVEKPEFLNHVLERLFGVSPHTSMRRGETSSRDLPLIDMDGIDSTSQLPKRRNNSFFGVVLLLIDVNCTNDFPELHNIVEQFRKGLHRGISCKVVWLNESRGRRTESEDITFLKPLQGSRLNRVLKMLPEFGGTKATEVQREYSLTWPNDEIEEEGQSLRYNKKLGKSIVTPTKVETWEKSVRSRKPIENIANEQGTSKPRDDEPFLSGKRVLVVDDQRTTSLLLTRKLKKMGALEVTQTDDGEKALRLVGEWFTQRKEQDSVVTLPFDYIFMDCQMPIMDGYEATREIRKMEREYGVHIPIIAVTSHDADSEEARETIKGGMDAYLDKTPSEDKIANIIRDVESKTLK